MAMSVYLLLAFRLQRIETHSLSVLPVHSFSESCVRLYIKVIKAFFEINIENDVGLSLSKRLRLVFLQSIMIQIE